MSTTIVFLIKFGSEENIDRLLHFGEIYCNTINYFRRVDDNFIRGDKYECKTFIKQINWLKFKAEGKEFEFNTKSQLFIDDHSISGNLYCLTAIKREDIDYTLINQGHKDYQIRLSPSLTDFGENALFIYNIPEFTGRVEKVLKEKNIDFFYAPITYQDFTTYEGDLNPFIKSAKYNYQKEFRFFINDKSNKPFTIKIGNLADIAIKARSAEIVNGIKVRIGLSKE